MTNALQPLKTITTKVGLAIGKISFVCLITVLLVACTKPEPIAYTPPQQKQTQDDNSEPQEYISSISLKEGKYRVDTNIILQNKNKKTLLADLTPEYLAEKRTIEEIPVFVKIFLDGISEKGRFDMVNAGEEWKAGIADFGHQVIKKVYSTEKKDSVLIVSYDRDPLPAKQLVYFGIGKNTALLSYYSGGIRLEQHVAIIKFEGTKIVDFWYGNYNSEATTTKAELIKQIIVSGTRNDKC